ncbi:MAG: hypothetical protein ACRD0P_19520, partial [Stackebrandtia sp.]
MESPTQHLRATDTVEAGTPSGAQSQARRHGVVDIISLSAVALVLLFFVGAGLWWLITTVASTVGSSFTAGKPLVEAIADPVRHLINTQADQLPISATTLWWTWAATATALFILAALGFHGARIGWAAVGAATTALVWIAHAPDTRVLAAALTASVWAVLAVLAFNRLTTSEHTKVVVFKPGPSGDED